MNEKIANLKAVSKDNTSTKKPEKTKITIFFQDNTELEVVCTWWGHALDNPDLLVYTDSEDDSQPPLGSVNLNFVKHMVYETIG